MNTKSFEIRDSGTFIPVMATKLNPACEADRWLMARSGFGQSASRQAEYVAVWRMSGGAGQCFTDPWEWGGGARTMQVAHSYIIENFDALESGAVICVETILGERTTPKTSERLDNEYPI